MEDQYPKELEKQKTMQIEKSSRKINNFLILARNAQNARDKRKKAEEAEIAKEREAWNETFNHIRRIYFAQQHEEFDFGR